MYNNTKINIILPLSFMLGGAFNYACADPVIKSVEPWSNTVLGYDKPVKQGLLGDMLGLRPGLADYGFTFRAAYLSENAYNMAGGYDHDRKLSYIDDFSLMFTQDLERYTGIPDAQIEGNIVNRNHNDNLTTERLQNPAVRTNDQAQEAYSGQSITRLGWLTFSRSFMDRKLHWRIGLINKNQDFDQVIPCDSQLISLCSGKSAKSGLWYNWNVHYWGTAFQYKLTPEVTLKTGLMEYNPSVTDRSHAWSWSTKGSSGFLLPMEVQWKTREVLNLPGAYNLGVLFTNGTRADLYDGNSGGAGVGDPQGYRNRDRTWYMYTGFNQQLTRQTDDANRGLSLSASLGVADQRTTAFHYVTSGTLRYRGPFDARPDDMVAIGVTYVQTGSHYQRKQAYLNQISGINDDSDPAYAPVPGHSVNYDLYYRFQVTPWLAVQPDIQLWHNPGGVRETQDAWLAGLKTSVIF